MLRRPSAYSVLAAFTLVLAVLALLAPGTSSGAAADGPGWSQLVTGRS